jgi:hypothetical protein
MSFFGLPMFTKFAPRCRAVKLCWCEAPQGRTIASVQGMCRDLP